MAAAPSPSKTTHRRVLGDVTPKAINTPSKQTSAIALEPSEATRAQSPLKQVTTLSPQLHVGKENMASVGAHPQGRKRSIYEVDDAENVELAKAMFGVRDQRTLGARLGLTAAAVQSHTERTAVDLAIPGSPTERNTPSPEPEALPVIEDSQDTQTSQASFSNLVDYSLCDASQKETLERPLAPVEEEKRSKAELLRTRLRFGYYKVETNQATKRGSEVISKWESSFSTDASTSMPLTSSSESAASQAVPSITLSSAHRDAQPVFVKVNLDPFRPIGKLTPAPVLLPTAVSSRMNYDYHMPSSPPQAISPEELMSPVLQKANYTTPVPKRIRTEEDQAQGDEKEETVHDKWQSRFQEGDLTSSAVKGNAANGLLELSHGRR
ncbi:hypothetical protein K458DRAFT_447656 [Lentithecium fluviatile CBS 122367]|uniref:Uncharacterized protein n=1 Tax=Lentithecium fluviatile CBS 122367 TaxID=1168545 RepID=A0A6G1ID98_9PLEO|nr:hypothetical protein K458DRAFT_447656 [Lentithecium fluviatile CBS 122367]